MDFNENKELAVFCPNCGARVTYPYSACSQCNNPISYKGQYDAPINCVYASPDIISRKKKRKWWKRILP